MFRFYANENLAFELVEILRQQGYDVLTSLEAGNANQRIPDDQVLRTATADNRVVITFNRDDFLRLHRSGVNHSGIIICKDDGDLSGLSQALYDYLIPQAVLKNRLLRVLKRNQRGFSFPVFTIQEYFR